MDMQTLVHSVVHALLLAAFTQEGWHQRSERLPSDYLSSVLSYISWRGTSPNVFSFPKVYRVTALQCHERPSWLVPQQCKTFGWSGIRSVPR